MKIDLIITDVDGVWTDGGMYYFNNGQEAKKFNTSDSVGVLLAKIAGVELMVLSGEDIPALQWRLEKLKIKHVKLGIRDKLSLVKAFAAERNIDFSNIAFIGDEVNDHPLLKAVGFAGCPSSAPDYTRAITDYTTPAAGGEGAFRDFVMEVLRRTGELDSAFTQLTQGIAD
jgi:YrbI family 3-deoxy-D-manno-octulosonate 8-phosphate phosphatase